MRRLPRKDPSKQFDRTVEALAFSSDNLAIVAGRLANPELPADTRAAWAKSLRESRTVLTRIIRSLERKRGR